MEKDFLDIINNIDISELKKVAKYLKNNKKKQVLEEINRNIKKRKKERKLDLNYRFKLYMINTYSLEDRKVLEKNKIDNMLDLIEANISSLEGIDAVTKESLEWAQKFYDLRKKKVKKIERK